MHVHNRTNNLRNMSYNVWHIIINYLPLISLVSDSLSKSGCKLLKNSYHPHKRLAKKTNLLLKSSNSIMLHVKDSLFYGAPLYTWGNFGSKVMGDLARR